jgi:hypothetical protein
MYCMHVLRRLVFTDFEVDPSPTTFAPTLVNPPRSFFLVAILSSPRTLFLMSNNRISVIRPVQLSTHYNTNAKRHTVEFCTSEPLPPLKKERGKRKSREGQVLPNPHTKYVPREWSDSQKTTLGLSHSQRSSRQADNWAQSRDQMKQDAYSWCSNAPNFMKQEIDRVVHELERRLNDEATAKHHMGCCCSSNCLIYSTSNVKILTFSGVGDVSIPSWRCENEGCMVAHTPRPMANGFFPSTPVAPTYWIDNRLLELYMGLGPVNGLSSRGTTVCNFVLTVHVP